MIILGYFNSVLNGLIEVVDGMDMLQWQPVEAAEAMHSIPFFLVVKPSCLGSAKERDSNVMTQMQRVLSTVAEAEEAAATAS